MKPSIPTFLCLISILLAGLLVMAATVVHAGPIVVPTAEGQLGDTPGAGDKAFGSRFESIRGQAGDILLGSIFVFGGAMPPPPETQFFTDRIHLVPNPLQVDVVPGTFDDVLALPPASARSRNAADDGDFVAFSFAVDGAAPQTMSVRLVTFDETGSTQVDVPVATVDTFPDPSLNQVGVAVDDQGRVTVVYTDLDNAGGTIGIASRRFDASGNPIGGTLPITPNGYAGGDVALLDPAGDRLIIPSSDFGTIRGNIVDTTGPTPTVLPEFPISTTPAAFANFLPQVAADPSTGAFVVAWENVTAAQGDPVNIRGRRFDAMGNPVGDDFVVNTTTANAQGQPAVAVRPGGGESVVVWAGDAATAIDALDVFAQAYDAAGQPIGGEIKVNTATTGIQDRPGVRFLPEPDAQGRPRFAVVWRDVDETDVPNGTGNSYKCFSIDGLDDPSEIFSDGFESGDTSSWSTTQN